MSRGGLPCPCCGHWTLDREGRWDICEICHWEDDPLQYDSPELEGGANAVSLLQARMNYDEFGACDEVSRDAMRAPLPQECPRVIWSEVEVRASGSELLRRWAEFEVAETFWLASRMWYVIAGEVRAGEVQRGMLAHIEGSEVVGRVRSVEYLLKPQTPTVSHVSLVFDASDVRLREAIARLERGAVVTLVAV